ncbi:hypothetical protein [Agromyces silvae]|uniref:hypothetical protein n=1 Tax=Agromyces silvae TaxID=3388266 RepID=UPI00280C2E92|nr:hypothetical protein [Agromyces protaetiae]
MSDLKALLWLGIEDYSGLWEAVWQLKSLHPNALERELAVRARSILIDLLKSDLVALYHCQEPYGALAAIDAELAVGLLTDERAWEAPEANAVSIRYSATPSGEDLYASLD